MASTTNLITATKLEAYQQLLKQRTSSIINEAKAALVKSTSTEISKLKSLNLSSSQHPLDPLSYDELTTVQNTVNQYFVDNAIGGSSNFDTVRLDYPEKNAVYAFDRVGSNPPPRKVVAHVSRVNGPTNAIYDFRIQLAPIVSIISVVKRPLADRVSWSFDALLAAFPIIFSDTRVRDALKRRQKLGGGNITDTEIDDGSIQINWLLDGRLHGGQLPPNIQEDPNRPCHGIMPNIPQSVRLYWVVFLYNGGSPLTINNFLQPIEGLVVFFNANTNSIVDILDMADPAVYPPGNCDIPVLTDTLNIFPVDGENPRYKLEPISVSQPRPSFGPVSYVDGQWKLDSHKIEWEKWSFRLCVNPRSGVEVFRVEIEDPDSPEFTKRSVLYKLAVDEMVTIYGDPQLRVANSQYLDFAEYHYNALSFNFSPVTAPPNAVYVPVAAYLPDGTPFIKDKAIAIYERDNGTLYSHFDFYGGAPVPDMGIRNRELVVSHSMTVGNYDYIVNKIFRQDGSIEVELLATGMLFLKGSKYSDVHEMEQDPDGFWDSDYGTLVAPYLHAPNHQHFFSILMDWDLCRDPATDQPARNRLYKVRSKSVSLGPKNAWGTAWKQVEELIETESDSPSDVNTANGVAWEIVNNSSHTSLGYHRGYKIEFITPNPKGLQLPESRFYGRTTFTHNNIHATRYRRRELFALGEFPVEKPIDVGLNNYITSNNDNLVDKNIVVRATLVKGHKPHVEEFPLMPVSRLALALHPHNFFERNPAMTSDRTPLGGGFTAVE